MTNRFTVPDAGTQWFHPHMGLELDRGLYAPLIIEDPHDPVCADVGATLMLDDWLGGYARTLRRDRYRARRRIPDCRRLRGKAHIPAEAVLGTSSSAVPPTFGSLPTELKGVPSPTATSS